AAVERLMPDAGLHGLNSADFLLGEGGFHLLEINPRPGATVDLFVHPDLFAWHIAACGGELPRLVPSLPDARAVEVAYAMHPLCLPDGFVWPEWTADRQPPGQPVPAGAPLCSVISDAPGLPQARALGARRVSEILRLAENAP
ncbi:MAG: hypothetical protein M3Y41_13820, partial [Pseudomonadota bacterium]|nr:hypothetical protein [Pseudomonadota bacterium]